MTAEARSNFPNDLVFYQASVDRLIEFAKFEGNSRAMFDSLQTALAQKPNLISPLIGRSVQIAQEKLCQDRTQNAAVILPFETALRTIASQDQTDLLYPSRWTPELVTEYLTRIGNEVAELAGEKTIGRNLPSRAAWMISTLYQTEILSQVPFFVELGAAAGFVLDALKKPTMFKSWLQSTNIPQNSAIDRISSSRDFNGFGVDLTPISDIPWAVACLGDDEAMNVLVGFLEKFPDRSFILGGDVANPMIWDLIEANTIKAANLGQTPVIVTSEMLYLLTPDKRQTVLENIRELLQRTNGYFLRAESGQNLEDKLAPELDLATIGELRDCDFNLIGPRLKLITKYSAQWKQL